MARGPSAITKCIVEEDERKQIILFGMVHLEVCGQEHYYK